MRLFLNTIWVKVFKNGPNKICGRQPLKNLKWHGLLFKSKKLITLKITFALIERDCVPQQQIDKKNRISIWFKSWQKHAKKGSLRTTPETYIANELNLKKWTTISKFTVKIDSVQLSLPAFYPFILARN